jgi:hypothetical protein
MLLDTTLGSTPTSSIISISPSAGQLVTLTGIIQKPESLSNAARALADYMDILKTQHCAAQNGDDLRALAARYKEKKGYGG